MSNKKRIQKILKRKYKYQGLLSSIKIFGEYKSGLDFAINGESKQAWHKIAVTDDGMDVFMMSKEYFEKEYCQDPIPQEN